MKGLPYILIFCASCLCMCSLSKNKNVNRYNANGKPHGQWVYYINDNQPQSYGRYKDGMPVGKWMIFNTDGSKCVKKRYYGNKTKEVWYHPSGRIEAKGWSKLLLDDPKEISYYWDGKWKFYDEKGKLLKISIYVKGEEGKIVKCNGAQTNE